MDIFNSLFTVQSVKIILSFKTGFIVDKSYKLSKYKSVFLEDSVHFNYTQIRHLKEKEFIKIPLNLFFRPFPSFKLEVKKFLHCVKLVGNTPQSLKFNKDSLACLKKKYS